MKTRTHTWQGAVALAGVVAALATAMAPASTAEAVTARATPCAKSRSSALNLVFDKNWTDPGDSRLYVCKGNSTLATYRAGSGLGKGKANSMNECKSERGWLPNGTYPIKFHTRSYNGTLIKGYAVALPNMRCTPDRVNRTDLFIHSEMNRDGNPGKSEERKWEGPRDYKSIGCIKLSPVHIRNLFNLFDKKLHAWPSRLYVVK